MLVETLLVAITVKMLGCVRALGTSISFEIDLRQTMVTLGAHY